jgi:hypothetical protein
VNAHINSIKLHGNGNGAETGPQVKAPIPVITPSEQDDLPF